MSERLVCISKIEISVRVLSGDPTGYRIRVMQEIDAILDLVDKFRPPVEKAAKRTGSQEQAHDPLKIDHSCPRCEKELVRRQGPKGAFIGCSGYPVCNYTEQIDK